MTTNYKVKITKTAENDIEKIWLYISKDSFQNAEEFINPENSGEDQKQTLEKFPNKCPVIPESDLLGIEYRNLIIGNYRIIFKVEKNAVYIMRALHGAKLLQL